MEINLSETDKQILARHSPGVRGRALIELQVVNALIKAASHAGFRLQIEDEDESPLQPAAFYAGNGSYCADVDRFKAALFNGDDVTLLVFNGNRPQAFGWIRLVFGNDGWDLVSDYSTNLETFLEPVQAVADFWGQ